MHHHHGDDHSNCPHANSKINEKNKSITFIVMLITGLFMGVEFVGGYISNSLALIADAGHMFTDFAALLLAWIGFYISSKPANKNKSFGYLRFQVITAFINGISILLLSTWIIISAIIRFFNPVEIMSPMMFIIASLGLIINIIALYLLNKANPNNLNIQGARIHVIGDLLGSIAAIASAIIIYYTSWMEIDAILSILIAVLLIKSALVITKKSINILLESTPEHLSQDTITNDIITNVDGITEITNIHIWSLNNETTIATMHILVDKSINCDDTKSQISDLLKKTYKISESTIQINVK